MFVYNITTKPVDNNTDEPDICVKGLNPCDELGVLQFLASKLLDVAVELVSFLVHLLLLVLVIFMKGLKCIALILFEQWIVL